MSTRFSSVETGMGHAIAVTVATIYTWQVSQSAYVTSGLQFIAPLLVIMLVHLGWLWLAKGLRPGFANLVTRRSLQTALGLVLGIVFINMIAPMPAGARGMDSAGNFFGGLLVILFCLGVVAAVGAALAFLVWLFYRLITTVFSYLSGNNNKNDTRLFDFGSLGVVFLELGLASLEGVPQAYRFAPAGQSAASVVIAASPAQVWQTMERTAQPSFALPEVLHVSPQPVAVLVDEGSTLGARRAVKIEGREGAGLLSLQVVERSETRAVFAVLSDTSPIAGWVGHRRLIYDVVPDALGTRLTVTLEFDRLLAPAVVFGPAITAAAYLAMDVLARDIKLRAEG